MEKGLQPGFPFLGMGAGVCDDDEVIRIADKITRGQGRSLTKRIALGILVLILAIFKVL